MHIEGVPADTNAFCCVIMFLLSFPLLTPLFGGLRIWLSESSYGARLFQQYLGGFFILLNLHVAICSITLRNITYEVFTVLTPSKPLQESLPFTQQAHHCRQSFAWVLRSRPF